MPDQTRPVRRFVLVVAGVAAADLLAKQLATQYLAGQSVALFGPVDLALVYNRASAFGVSLGSHTWHLNVLTTFAALALTLLAVRALAAVDRRAPIALGLIGGAALGNLTSLLVPPAGVADFLSVAVGNGGRIIMNLADLAAYAGIALLGRSFVRVRRAIVATRRAPRRTPAFEVEVPIALTAEPAARAGIPAPARRAPAVSPNLPTEHETRAD